MEGASWIEERRQDAAAPWRFVVLALGAFLTLKGYHSLDGDQAYRLPLLLHRLDPELYADDPFVRAFDAFNPHRGSLGLLATGARTVGLPATLALLFAATFLLTVRAFHRLAVRTWPGLPGVGWVAAVLMLTAKAGNIGTNHVFEATLLDRLMGLALAWMATAAVVENPARGWRIAAVALGAAGWIHPSLGLQIALVFVGSLLLWSLLPSRTETSWRRAIAAGVAISVATAPGIAFNLYPFGNLREGLSPETFRLLSVELQSPQHMLPHLWRQPQWLAAGAYLVLAAVALLGACADRSGPSEAQPAAARWRLSLMLVAVLAWLLGSWVAVEIVQHIGATVFQPFRVATFGRGLCLILASGRVVQLWNRGTWPDRLRVGLILFGCSSDWLFVWAAATEAVLTILELVEGRFAQTGRVVALLVMLALAGRFLARHDTEGGVVTLALAIAVSLGVSILTRRISAAGRSVEWSGRRYRAALAMSWALPVAAILMGLWPTGGDSGPSSMGRALAARWRFLPIPIDDAERLAVWCRENSPPDARFIGPPGPKEFRLWSQRNWVFNRAGSPYHADGLRDWYERFRRHVDFDGTPEEFVRAYQDGRHRLEARYDALSDRRLAELATSQGAEYVVAGVRTPSTYGGPLELLHEQGRYAVYRVRPDSLVQNQP